MGFSAEWLALRGPADRAARDTALARRAAVAAGPAPLIVDLGCGGGATVEALAPYLPKSTRWRLVDHDSALLRIAAGVAGPNAETVQADLAELGELPLAGATLVTASALLDLASEAWIAGLVQRLGVPFYAALNYDGRMEWTPPDPQDNAITSAFNHHQRSDKGFGPALGPDAAPRAAALLEQAGFEVDRADSPWQLGPGSASLQREVTGGIAAAAAQAGTADAAVWGARRAAAADSAHCHVGHVDLLAHPPSQQGEAPHVQR